MAFWYNVHMQVRTNTCRKKRPQYGEARTVVHTPEQTRMNTCTEMATRESSSSKDLDKFLHTEQTGALFRVRILVKARMYFPLSRDLGSHELFESIEVLQHGLLDVVDEIGHIARRLT